MIFLLIADLIYASACVFLVLLHPISTGVNHVPIKAVATTVNNVATSGGIGGGGVLKFAVKVPNLLTSKVADVSFDIPKALKNEFEGV
jgi:hypothetical protein